MSLQDILAELQKTYLASLPEKITTLETLWSERKLVLLKTEYHKLKGTGRTYGFPEISQIGEALERLCEGDSEVLAQAVPLSTRLITRVLELRLQGKAMDLENEADFRTLVVWVTAMPQAD